jgi:hypothetical protein
MPKFTFIGEHADLFGNPDGTKLTYEFTVDSLGSVLEHADLFIRGCGYNPSGVLDYIPNEEYYGGEEQPELSKSKYYFDTERNR